MTQTKPHSIPWTVTYEKERRRLQDALGEITAGGTIEAIAHVGSTSVPGLTGRDCVDIALAVAPFPPQVETHARLKKLGYTAQEDGKSGFGLVFLHSGEKMRLIMVDPGEPHWLDLLILRDYLRADEGARKLWNTQVGEILDTLGRSQKFDQLLSAARPWWIANTGFAPVEAVAQELGDFAYPWFISGGWALDLFLGSVNRVHHDADVVVARSDQLALRQYLSERGWKLLTPYNARLEPWPLHMRLEQPRHQVHAHREGAFIDFLLTDFDSTAWRYRRDPLILRSTERMALESPQGIPFMAPELVLLYKSKNTTGKERMKDQEDFQRVLRQLEVERRLWLMWALEVTEPGHPWIDLLKIL